MGEGVPIEDHDAPRAPDWAARLGSVSVDGWATAVAGVIVALAVADMLPKISW
ncbi:hypothetical protein [Mycobacterium sp. 852002-51971_SCH5477799-a]|uniref:hypothetical protein n=1 Tax=Mycobacterium sp. 852002-51971_SCH5477799-a TaxID=1834106 RepID=UPI000ADC79B6|nr:hypothetical protein [Mycobacterium sp. 852002-51971_SCH5477799-a]